MAPLVNRRRFLGITAAVAIAGPLAARGSDLHVWTGTALGGLASLRLYHPDRRVAEAAIARCVAELGRLERVFSLYHPDSAVSRLNRDGELVGPPLDLVRLLDDAARFHRLTDGAFDVTVQPLWRLYAEHFGADPARRRGPDDAAVAAALAIVGQDKLSIEPGGIAFARPGMGVTLNGIAQGYITDRVADLLRQEGFADVLVDLGEARASGERPDGSPWRAALADPRTGAVVRQLDLRERALATSAPSGFAFDAAGRFPHILDPLSGLARATHASVSVLAPDATTADALSTAFVQMPSAAIARVLGTVDALAVHVLHADARLESMTSGAA